MFSVRLIEDMTGIGKSTIHRILSEDLKEGLCKIPPPLPYLLNDVQKVQEFLSSKGVIVPNIFFYSPDLSPHHYLLFSKLKLHLKGTTFNSISDIQGTATDHLTHMPKADFRKCFLHYYINCNKWNESSENYFEET